MANEPLVLAVDDEMGILRLITLELTAQGFRVITASTGDEALTIAEAQRPDIVLLDVVMPEMTGHEVLRALRERAPVPVILVTARDREIDKVRGLELGADDYIVKPFNPKELVARIRTRLRPAGQPANDVLRIGDLTVDVAAHEVRRADEAIALTPLEFELLVALASKPQQVFSREMLLEQVWGYHYKADTRLVNVHVQRLRAKVEQDPDNPKIVTTVRGVGYRAGAVV